MSRSRDHTMAAGASCKTLRAAHRLYAEVHCGLAAAAMAPGSWRARENLPPNVDWRLGLCCFVLKRTSQLGSRRCYTLQRDWFCSHSTNSLFSF